ncbi:hypothetical protein KOM00_01835 [Geomonas sp. Red69]|uniref:PAS domain-containing protein n=1 Tax=Geomonas diazotrophica TaxID=2843197 RepID=A0ABX8JGG0_9BACT|nr:MULTISPECIES: hypothetical protein [Geomonas]MBU5635471.1 hypothetical protein [Geomonas diazotrophica]QWV97480.1 hypothetical protein KP005_19430 [Geomonas nitrogeniifigens]QXE86619.1 hypothetical protein KP003_20085 [Geomonas nitrogeniifigens]
MSQIEVSEEIRRNFHLFWDNYPEPVMLIYKDRTILEANKAAQTLGYPTGLRCVDLGEKKHHAGCRANVALRDKTGVRDTAWYDFRSAVLDSYWIPLAGAEDFYVHFANDITEFASERLIPKSCEGGCASCSGH